MRIEKRRKPALELRQDHSQEHISEVNLKERKPDKLKKRWRDRSQPAKLEDETALFVRKESERLIKDIYDQSQAEINKVTAQLIKDRSDPNLTPTEIASLEKQADKDQQEIKQTCEKTVNETKLQLRYQSHADVGYLLMTMAKENAKKEKQVSVDKSKKIVAETATKLHKRSIELEKLEPEVTKRAERLKKSLKDLEDVRSATMITDSHTTLTLEQYTQALTDAHDTSRSRKAKKANKNAYRGKAAEGELNEAADPRTGTLRAAFRAAHDVIDNENEDVDARTTAVKTLVRQALQQHTTFRLVKADTGDAQFLSPEAHLEKRLHEVLAQEDVHKAVQQARQNAGTDDQQFKKTLKKAVKETIRYAWQMNSQEEIVHQQAAKQFQLQIKASTDIRHDVWKEVTASLKPGRKEKIASIENVDAEMQRALDLIRYLSPEAAKAVQTFRKQTPDLRTSPLGHDRDTALQEIQHSLKKSSASLPTLHENIQRYLNVDTKTETQEIPHIAKSAIHELMKLGNKQNNDTVGIDRKAYEQMNNQISERYDKAIQKAQAAYERANTEAQAKWDKELKLIEKELTKKQQSSTPEQKKVLEAKHHQKRTQGKQQIEESTREEKKTLADLEAQRAASLAEVARLYPKESISKRIEKVQKHAQKLQEVLAKRDRKINDLNDTIAEGERAYLTQKRYEQDNQGDYLLLEGRMLQQGQKVQEAQGRLSSVMEKVTFYQDQLHKAEVERDYAKNDFERMHRDMRFSDMKDASPGQSKEHDPLLTEARKRYANAREEVRKAQQKHEEILTEKVAATAAVDHEQQRFNTLETQRDMAKKLYDSDEDKWKRHYETGKDIMKATVAYERQERLMKMHYRYQIRIAIISGISQALVDVSNKIGTSQFTAINNMLLKM